MFGCVSLPLRNIIGWLNWLASKGNTINRQEGEQGRSSMKLTSSNGGKWT